MAELSPNDTISLLEDRQSWRWQLHHAIRDPARLARHCGLSDADAVAVAEVAAAYPVMVTPYYLSLARVAAHDDPIIRQVLPHIDELRKDGEGDPFGEETPGCVHGVVHRYPDRVLFILTNQCAVHCRHCLRKRLWKKPSSVMNEAQVRDAVKYVAERPGIREVIVSGGDPLLLPETFVMELLGSLHAIEHVEIVRLATRLPVVLPQRFEKDFCERLGSCGPVWLITHFNHPYELTTASSEACENLVRAGIPVLNQTVLLRGVNDDLETIRMLCTGLLRMRVKPYYLFHGDPVAGALHFRTGIRRGLEIMEGLRGHTSGLAIPAFAIDLPGGAGKVPLTPGCLAGQDDDGRRAFRSFQNEEIFYDDGAQG